MRFLTKLILCVLLTGVGCEKIFLNENETPTVSAVVQNDEFIISNRLSFEIYFFAVDEETSHVIDWIPEESESNRVNADSFRNFSVDTIFEFREGKKAIAFIWNTSQSYWETIEIDQTPEE